VVEFRGPGACFSVLTAHQRLVRQALRQITRPRWLAQAAAFRQPVIGINVRRGKDFHEPATDTSVVRYPFRTPLQWFVDALILVRREVGWTVPALLVSDGSAADLAPILRLERVELVRPGSAIGDLWTLARSRVLLGSGGSSFSAWAAFLGAMTTVTIPGQSLEWFGLRRAGDRYLGELDIESPDEAFLDQCREALAPGSSSEVLSAQS
jgi:hypothetical protein